MKKVLLCRPHFFRVDYQINPWMKIGAVDRLLALAQWETLLETYQNLGVSVEIIDQEEEHPDMVFAADQSVVIGDNHLLLSRFRYPERSGESEIYHHWFQKMGYRVTLLPEDLYFEGGGEMQNWRDKVFIGTGFRTDKKAAYQVSQILGREAVCVQLIHEHFYHLDTCFFVLNNDVIFYYPKAFSANSIQLLQSVIPKLIEIDETEANNFAANSVVVGDIVLIQKGNPKLTDKVKELGFQVKTVDISEFMKAGGGIHCLTGDLE